MATSSDNALDKSQAVVASTDILDLGGAVDRQQGESLLKLALRRLRRDYLTLIAFAVLIILVILSLLAPVISNALDVSYRKTDVSNAFAKIGDPGHVLGTDDLGRDQLSRLLYAGRISLGIAIAAALVSLIIGMSLGVVAGFYQGTRLGFIDDALLWFITTLNSIPSLFLLLIITAFLTPSVVTLVGVLAFLSWSGTMRLVRGETLSQREREYIIAARSIGASEPRIMFFHILPNIFSVIIINLAQDIGGLILVESALSFLNLGVRAPTPSWGNMLTNAQTFFNKGVHLVVLPGSLIVITVLCLFIIGDGLRDAFDPQANKKVA